METWFPSFNFSVLSSPCVEYGLQTRARCLPVGCGEWPPVNGVVQTKPTTSSLIESTLVGKQSACLLQKINSTAFSLPLVSCGVSRCSSHFMPLDMDFARQAGFDTTFSCRTKSPIDLACYASQSSPESTSTPVTCIETSQLPASSAHPPATTQLSVSDKVQKNNTAERNILMYKTKRRARKRHHARELWNALRAAGGESIEALFHNLTHEELFFITWTQTYDPASEHLYQTGTLEIWFRDRPRGLKKRTHVGIHNEFLRQVDLMWREEDLFEYETVNAARVRDLINAL